MTLYQFNLLPYEARLATVHETGMYIATRWEEVNASVLLYHLPAGVFAELCYDTDTNQITDVRAFTSAAPLADYPHY